MILRHFFKDDRILGFVTNPECTKLGRIVGFETGSGSEHWCGSDIRDPGSERNFQYPISGIRDSKNFCNIRYPGSGIRKKILKSDIRDPGSEKKFQDPISGIRDPKKIFKIRYPGSGIRKKFPTSDIRDPGSEETKNIHRSFWIFSWEFFILYCYNACIDPMFVRIFLWWEVFYKNYIWKILVIFQ